MGLPTSLTIQRPGLTSTGYHGAGDAAGQAAKGSAMYVVCPRRNIPDFLGSDLHPARPNDDVSTQAWLSWLSFSPATTPINGDRGARPPTFKGDSMKTP